MRYAVNSFDFYVSVSDGESSKQMAFFTALRNAIKTRSFSPNQKLPSTREFARINDIARGTAVIVYEMLEAEGYVISKPGAGTFVSESLPDDRLTASVETHSQERAAPPPPMRSARTPLIGTAGLLAGSAGTASRIVDAYPKRGSALSPSGPALGEFPISLWAKLTARSARLAKPEFLGGGGAGFPRLRKAIAAHLRWAKGIDCADKQIVLTLGTRDSLSLCAHVLAAPGNEVLVEDPGCPTIAATLQAIGLTPVPVPVDAEGIQISTREPGTGGSARLVHVTPAHQFPTGVAMSAERRQALLDWATSCDGWIFEEDCEGDFRYAGRPAPSLFSMDRHGRVIHAGSFSKTVFPALHIGYVVVPADLVDPLIRAQASIGRHPAMQMQLVLCDFIESGHYGRHVRRMTECYRQRRACLLDALHEHFGRAVSVTSGPCGLHLAAAWSQFRNGEMLAHAASAQGVDLLPLSHFQLGRRIDPRVLLGFAAYDTATLRSAVGKLAKAVDGHRAAGFHEVLSDMGETSAAKPHLIKPVTEGWRAGVGA